LEDKRGRAANPHTKEEWWKLLKEILIKYSIKPHNLYGSDEVAVLLAGQGEREVVFRPAQPGGAPKQQTEGTQENITVICTICADGTSVEPGVIFKGIAYDVRWGDNNPLNAL